MTTHWTMVLVSGTDSEDGREALRVICDQYYEPVVSFLGFYAGDEARDLAHEFFASILQGNSLSKARKEQGRFRSYLLGALKHFVAKHRAAAGAAKRGGGAHKVALDAGTDTSPGMVLPDPHALSPDSTFDRDWALALIGHALGDLRMECQDEGKAERFESMKPWLTGEADHGAQVEAARSLGLPVGTFKSEVHRLKRRFRAMVRARVRATLADSSAVDAEMSSLFAALRGK